MAVPRGQHNQLPPLDRDDGARGEISKIRDLHPDVCVRDRKGVLLLCVLHLARVCLHDVIHHFVLKLQEL